MQSPKFLFETRFHKCFMFYCREKKKKKLWDNDSQNGILTSHRECTLHKLFVMDVLGVGRNTKFHIWHAYLSKREVPRGVRNSKVRRQDKFRRDWSRHKNTCKSQSGTGPGVRRSKRPLSACHTRCICSMETLHN